MLMFCFLASKLRILPSSSNYLDILKRPQIYFPIKILFGLLNWQSSQEFPAKFSEGKFPKQQQTRNFRIFSASNYSNSESSTSKVEFKGNQVD
jgi:hypothetical protein